MAVDTRVTDLEEFALRHIWRPFYPWYVDTTVVPSLTKLPMSLNDTAKELAIPSRWRDAVIDRISKIGFKFPDYVQHPLVHVVRGLVELHDAEQQKTSEQVEQDLWAVHMLGIDDLLPCASRMLAVRNATWGNLTLLPRISQLIDEIEPLTYQVPVRWEGTPEAHAEGLTEQEHQDMRWSDPGADVLHPLMEELLRSRDAYQDQVDEASSQAAEVRAAGF